MNKLDPFANKPQWAMPYRPWRASVGAWEGRVWTACFWATLIAIVWQAYIAWSALFGSKLAADQWYESPIPSTPTSIQIAYAIVRNLGFVIEVVVGAMFAPLGMLGFARARIGRPHTLLLFIWLLSRFACATAFGIAAAILWQANPIPVSTKAGGHMWDMRGFLVTYAIWRVGIFNLPLLIWLLGTPIIYLERWARTRGAIAE